MKKTETCYVCKKAIDLIESAYHESMCVDCYRDKTFDEFNEFVNGMKS